MKKLFCLILLGILFQVNAQMPILQSVCGNNNFNLVGAGFQLTSGNPDVQISYHTSQNDATLNINPIINPENYVVVSSPELVYFRMTDTSNGNISYYTYNLIVTPLMTVNVVQTMNTPTSDLFVEVVGGQEPLQYVWQYNGAPIAGQTGSNLNILNFPSGIFTVTVTDGFGCVVSSTIQAGNGPIISANDDAFTVTNLDGWVTPPGIGNILMNDSVNGFPATLNNVMLTVVSGTNPGISLDSEGGILVNNQTPNGTYTFVYQICELANPNNCDTATVTVTISYCRADTPVIDSVVLPTCNNIEGAVVHVSGLPSVGTWQLTLVSQTGAMTSLQGNGVNTSIENLVAGSYSMTVRAEDILLGNCFESFPVDFTINQQYGLTSNMTGNYVDTNANGITDVGDTIDYQFTINNTACIPATLILLDSESITISGDTIPVMAGDTSNSTNYTGTYVLTQNDINVGGVQNSIDIRGYYYDDIPFFVHDSLTVDFSLPDGIRLNAFFDLNNNGFQDNNEQNFTEGSFSYQLNGGAAHNIFSSTGDYYLFETNPINSYNISYILNPSNGCQFNYTLATASYSNITVTAGSGIVTYNFAVSNSSSCLDLSVNLFNYATPPRPGFTYQNQIWYQNDSNQTIASGTVTFKKDALLSIISTSQTGTTATADGFTYDFTNLNPHEARSIVVTMQVPLIPTINLGDFLTNTVEISLLPADINQLNNADTLRQMVVGSYDPNDKTESHGGKIVFSDFSANDYLTYTIRFENTGNAEAINIRVEDVLDDQLDETSIRMLRASHPYVLDRVGNVLNWSFNDVNLPPSVEGDDVTGHGYVVFQVKPKPGFALGDVIPNTAEIYFDFNPAIVTDPCVTEFVTALANDTFAFNDFKVYPNPVKNTFHIDNDSTMDAITITSISGQTILQKNINGMQAEIDLSQLANGVYFAKITSKQQQKTIKLIKE